VPGDDELSILLIARDPPRAHADKEVGLWSRWLNSRLWLAIAVEHTCSNYYPLLTIPGYQLISAFS